MRIHWPGRVVEGEHLPGGAVTEVQKDGVHS